MKLRRRKSFTLIEILLVTVILGILAGLLLPSLSKTRKRARHVNWVAFNNHWNADPHTVLNLSFHSEGFLMNYQGSMEPAIRNSAIGCEAEGFDSKNYDGRLVGAPEWVIGGGRWGYNDALQFDGKNDYIEIPGTKALDFNTTDDDFTVSLWVNLDKLTGQDLLFSKSDSPTEPQYATTLQNKGVLAEVGTAASSFSTPLPEKGKWTHYALVFNNGELEMFCNGTLMNGRADPKKIKTKINSSSTLLIGAAVADKKNKSKIQFNIQGRIDEFLLFSRALSRAEINAIFTMGSPY